VCNRFGSKKGPRTCGRWRRPPPGSLPSHNSFWFFAHHFASWASLSKRGGFLFGITDQFPLWFTCFLPPIDREMPAQAKAPRLPTLDGWRAVAVLLVIWCHFGTGLWSSEDAFETGTWAHWGNFGVDIFFGISGLLITKLLLEERDREGEISLKAFYTRRAFRILPPCLAYLAVVWMTVGFKTPWEFLSSVFFFRNYIPYALVNSTTGHLWSLSVEEHFYLLWPTLLIWLGRRRGATGAAWLGIGIALWRVAEANNHWTEALLAVPVHFRTDLRLDSLLWGCVAAFVLHDSAAFGKAKEAIFYLGMASALTCIVFYSYLTGVWLPILIPCLLAGTVANPQWTASRVLANPLLVRIGKMSYSLYLWQQLFLIPGWEHRSVLQTPPWNLLLTLACAFASYRLIEKPCMEFGRSLADRLRQPERVEACDRS
jgi:peptidoglycan/LPS O-acetylase OafA/YrhL